MIDPKTTLQELLLARGPVGQEEEVRSVCEKLMNGLVDEVSTDPAGNLIGFTKGEGKAPPVRIMVHMDEISLVVKRVRDDGTLKVEPLGGIFPFTFGQGPVDILGDKKTLPGILSNGCMHTSSETKHASKGKPNGRGDGEGKAVGWKDVYVVTRKSVNELAEAGVHPGSRVVISQSRRHIHEVGDCLASYYMDNRAAITIALLAMDKLRAEKKKPAGDVYVVCSVQEEIGGIGACYAARTLPGDITLAIDVGPVAEEYGTELTAAPMVVYKDGVSIYTHTLCSKLLTIGNKLGLNPQPCVFEAYGSDASIPKKYGQSAQAALIAFPTENTHGYEMIHCDAMDHAAQLVAGYLSEA